MFDPKKALEFAALSCLFLLPSTASAQSAFDTLTRTTAPSSTPSSSRASSRKADPGARLTLDSREGALKKTSAVTLEPWLEPSGKHRTIEVMSGSCQGFVLIEESVKGTMHLGDPVTTSMLELATGERFETPNTMAEFERCEGDYIVFESTTMGPAAFHIPTKRWHEPELLVPAGIALGPVTTIAPVEREAQAASEFLIRAFTKGDRTPYQGLWRLGEGAVEMNQHMPWDGVERARLRGDRIEVLGFALEKQTYSEFGSHATRTRTSIQPAFYTVGETITREVALAEGEKVTFLPGGYTAYVSGKEAHVIHPDGEHELVEMQSCERHASAILAAYGQDEPSVLFACQTGTTDTSRDYFMAYWTPQGLTTWRDTHPGQLSIGIGGAYEPSIDDQTIRVLPVYPHTINARAHHMWFDTRTGATWEGKARYSVHIAPRGMGTRSLASDAYHDETQIAPDKRINLYLIDIDAGTETLLHTYTDCPGRIQSPQISGDFARIDCVTNNKPGHYRFLQQWSEVLDLRDGTRWRAPHSRSVRKVFEDGSFIVSDVDKGDNILYKASRKLWFGRFD